MPDDWSWFWAGENGRDNLLRDEIEGLQSRASAASQQSAQLSSQLRRLQGSIESRLQALSTAFDAYVELGDVREQLAGYPDTSAVRREALRALSVLDQGGRPEPLEADAAGYWLVEATNEVIALASGEPVTRTADAAARPRDTEHEMFVVAALGWLGQGARVAERVPGLLLGDGALAAPQVVLWRALVHGRFGDAALAGVREPWRRDLDLGAPTWDRFTTEHQADDGPVGTLRLVAALLDGRWTPPEVPSRGDAGTEDRPANLPANRPEDGDRVGLRRVVDALVGAGTGDERVLLERARVLRARIEDPAAAEPDPTAEPPRTPTTALVQEALLDPAVDAASRAELVGWVRPGLEAVARAVAADVAAGHLAPRLVHTEMGQVEVSGSGADEARLAELDRLAVQRYEVPRARVLVPGVGAAVLVVVGLVLLRTDLASLGVVALVMTLALVVVTVRTALRARSNRTELAEVRERTRRRVDEGRTTAAADEAADRTTRAEVATLARAITGEAAGPSRQEAVVGLR